MEFFVYETGENIKASLRPIVMITSNNEEGTAGRVPARCFFHYIKFPDADTMGRIATCTSFSLFEVIITIGRRLP